MRKKGESIKPSLPFERLVLTHKPHVKQAYKDTQRVTGGCRRETRQQLTSGEGPSLRFLPGRHRNIPTTQAAPAEPTNTSV